MPHADEAGRDVTLRDAAFVWIQTDKIGGESKNQARRDLKWNDKSMLDGFRRQSRRETRYKGPARCWRMKTMACQRKDETIQTREEAVVGLFLETVR